MVSLRKDVLEGFGVCVNKNYNYVIILIMKTTNEKRALDKIGYSGEKGQSNCRESGRCSAVKAATIPVKKTSAKRESRGWCFYTVTVSALWSSIDRFRRIDSPFSSSL